MVACMTPTQYWAFWAKGVLVAKIIERGWDRRPELVLSGQARLELIMKR